MYVIHMPTIFEFFAFKIMIRTRDHKPPHVHCISADGEVLISIEGQTVVRNHGVHTSDVKRLCEFVRRYEDVLMNEWRHYHEED